MQALCAVTWLGVACACTLEPRYRAPALPVPDRWPIPATTLERPATAPGGPGVTPERPGVTPERPAVIPERPGLNVAAHDIGCRDFFLDTRLEQLIELALANNRDLRVAVLNIEQVRAQYRIQRAALLPSIDASGSFIREKLPASLTYGIATPTTGYLEAGLCIT